MYDPEYFRKLKEAEDSGDNERAEKLRAAREAYRKYTQY